MGDFIRKNETTSGMSLTLCQVHFSFEQKDHAHVSRKGLISCLGAAGFKEKYLTLSFKKRRTRGGSLLRGVSSVLPRRWPPMQTMLQPWKRPGRTSLETTLDIWCSWPGKKM